jgi:hypothetical protein
MCRRTCCACRCTTTASRRLTSVIGVPTHRPAGTSTGVVSGNNAGPAGTTGTATLRHRRRRCPLTSAAIRRAATRKSRLGSRRSALRTSTTARASQCRAKPMSGPIVRRSATKAGRHSRRGLRRRRCPQRYRLRSQVPGRMHNSPHGSRTDRPSHSHHTYRANRQRRRSAATRRVVVNRTTQDSRRRVTTSCPTDRRCTSQSGRCSRRSHGPSRRRRQGLNRLYSHAHSRMHNNPRASRSDRKPHTHRTHRDHRQHHKTGTSPTAAPKRPTGDRTNWDDGKGHQGCVKKDDRVGDCASPGHRAAIATGPDWRTHAHQRAFKPAFEQISVTIGYGCSWLGPSPANVSCPGITSSHDRFPAMSPADRLSGRDPQLSVVSTKCWRQSRNSWSIPGEHSVRGLGGRRAACPVACQRTPNSRFRFHCGIQLPSLQRRQHPVAKVLLT